MRQMKKITVRLLLIMFIVGVTAQVAMAQVFLPFGIGGRFAFSFFNSFLNNAFLFPFQLVGC